MRKPGCRLLVLFPAFVFTISAYAWDVGFSDSSFFIKTKLSGKDLTVHSFYLCPIGGNEDEGECIKLSSCSYPEADINKAAEKEKDIRQREEFELLTTASYQSQIKSVDYLKAFFTMLDGLDAKKVCAIVTSAEVPEGKDLVLAQVRLPSSYEVDGAAALERRLEAVAEKLAALLVQPDDKSVKPAVSIKVKEVRLQKESNIASVEFRFQEGRSGKK